MRKDEEILDIILSKRGIKGTVATSEFLSDLPQKTYDPFLLLNMEAGVDLLLSEIKKGSKICIYGDYDADGVTSVCILLETLKRLTDNIMYYIPSRFDEGYGLNNDAISRLHDADVDLIVTVDCGSVSAKEVAYAEDLGMKVIVTDHHSIDDIKADCILINPKQPGCSYPFKELAGCGVAFKLVQALREKTNISRTAMNDLLDLVAVGTVADIVSLTDENRTLVKYGLNRINAGKRRGLKKLKEAIALKEVSSENIAFGIGPHINAAGRIADAGEAVELFTAKSDDMISRCTANLVAYNAKRKDEQDKAYNQCIELIRGDEDFIMLDVDDIHEGIAGIVAGKIKETYNRPVIIMTPSGEGFLKGTGRSIPQINIYSLLKRHDSLFDRFGGHKGACGFLMKKENLSKFREKINADIDEMKEENPGIFAEKADYDLELDGEEITISLARKLKLLEPFGEGNRKPIFLVRNIIPRDVRFMGAEQTHVKFTMASESKDVTEYVLFGKAQEKKSIICSGRPVNVMGTIDIHVWQGRENVQFMIEEICL